MKEISTDRELELLRKIEALVIERNQCVTLMKEAREVLEDYRFRKSEDGEEYLNDDVTDIVVRVAAGALLGPVPNLGDGVNFNIGAQWLFANDGLGNYGQGGVLDVTANGIAQEFPFLPTPFDGRNRRHIDCDEPGGKPCN